MDTDRSVGEVTNVGNTEEITIEDLALKVKERIDSTSAIEFVPYDKAYEEGFEDMMRRVPSVEKLFALTGFKPQTPLTEIIDRVTLSFQAKPGHTPEIQVPVKRYAAGQGSQHLS